MEFSPLFNAPKPATNDKEFTPPKNLPEHLEEFAKISRESREKMSSPLSSILALTDLMALRSSVDTKVGE